MRQGQHGHIYSQCWCSDSLLLIICMSSVGHLQVICRSSVGHLQVICMSSVCHLYVICLLLVFCWSFVGLLLVFCWSFVGLTVKTSKSSKLITFRTMVSRSFNRLLLEMLSQLIIAALRCLKTFRSQTLSSHGLQGEESLKGKQI